MTKAVEKIDQLSFEDALGELETIVKSLESGSIPLEQSIAAYERGMGLKQLCERKLSEARLRVEKIALDNNGAMTGTTPFNPDQS